jgi:hypothetical protein
MGFSYTQAAGRTMEAIEAACKRARQPGETSTNEFWEGRARYFFEIDRQDQPDGGIRGEVHLTWDNAKGTGWARLVSTFAIDGRGRVVRGPALFHKAAQE